MRRTLVLLATLSAFAPIALAQQSDKFSQRKKLWQDELESRPYIFLGDQPGLFISLENYSATCQLNIVVDPVLNHPYPKHRMSFKFIRDGKEVLNLPGHTESDFRTVEDKLYVTNDKNYGCGVSAYDLSDGKELWTIDNVSELRPSGHSAYSNQVNLRLSRRNEAANEPEAAAIIVTGQEGIADYISVLDRKTGIPLAHKVYRQGFGGTAGAGGATGGEIKKLRQRREQ